MTAEELIKQIEKELAWPRAAGFALSSYDSSYALSKINRLISDYNEQKARTQPDAPDLPLEVLRKMRPGSTEE